MLFNSFEFAIFLLIVFLLYWFVINKNIKCQNFLLLIASYFFYGYWDWRFLSLIFISSICDYLIGLNLPKSKSKLQRKVLLFLSLVINLGFLGFFKYFNFFVDSFIDLFGYFGIHLNARSLNIILPVGISFYTFQTLSYTIDIYKNKLEPTKDIIAFFAFVSFFPQLVAGPIERAKNLLPQFTQPRQFDYQKAKDGMRQILWGLLKKIVIADKCAIYADRIFADYTNYNSPTLILGVIYFAFQIYGDFSGYSDIAIGTARLFGFDLMKNFALPYFSRDIGEFWRRWHISLSTWFRDYVYIPLGGSRSSTIKQIRNIIITFTVSGLWHGANWTFVIWGFLNGLYYLPSMIFKKPKNKAIVAENTMLPSFKEMMQIIGTFILTLFAWIFFRAENLSHALGYIGKIFTAGFNSIDIQEFRGLFWITILVILEWVQRTKDHPLQIDNIGIVFRWVIYLIILMLIFKYFAGAEEFIYFAF